MDGAERFLEKSRSESYSQVAAAVSELERSLKETIPQRKEEILKVLSNTMYNLPGSLEIKQKAVKYYDDLLKPKTPNAAAGVAGGKSDTGSGNDKSNRTEKNQQPKIPGAIGKKPSAAFTTGHSIASGGKIGDALNKVSIKSGPMKNPTRNIPADENERESIPNADETVPTNDATEDVKVATRYSASKKMVTAKSGASKRLIPPTIGMLKSFKGAGAKTAGLPKAVSSATTKLVAGTDLGPEAVNPPLPMGVVSAEMMELLELAATQGQIRFFDGRMMPSHPWILMSATKLVPIACTFMKDIALAKVCLAANFEAFVPNDDQMQDYSELKTQLSTKLDNLEESVHTSFINWRNYCVSRPTTVKQCIMFPRMEDLTEALKQMDRKIMLEMTAFLSETVKGYSSIGETLREVSDFVVSRALIQRRNFYM